MVVPCDAALPSASPCSFAGTPHSAPPPPSSISRAAPPPTSPPRARVLFAPAAAESVSGSGPQAGAVAASGTGPLAHCQPPPHDLPMRLSMPLPTPTSAPAACDMADGRSQVRVGSGCCGGHSEATKPHEAPDTGAAIAPDARTPPREARRRTAPSRSPSPPPVRQCDRLAAGAGSAQAAAGAGAGGAEAAGAAAGGGRQRRGSRGGKLERARKRTRAWPKQALAPTWCTCRPDVYMCMCMCM